MTAAVMGPGRSSIDSRNSSLTSESYGTSVIEVSREQCRPAFVTFAVVSVVQHPRTAGRAKGGQLSVAVLTLGELVRVAILARLDENAARKVPLARRDSAR